MKSRPILFSGPMVRALLDDTKTQTRRVGKIQSQDFVGLKAEAVRHATLGYQIQATYDAYPGRGTARHAICACPFGQPGDQLWVRETHGFGGDAYTPDTYYRATDPEAPIQGRWHPSIHMPRSASRIKLEITGVRVERLQDISEADAQAEGCALECMTPIGDDSGSAIHGPGGYIALWESINGPGSWDLNPWVWVVEFRRLS